MVVTKTNLIDEIAEATGVSKKDTKAVVESFWNVVKTHVEKDDAVQFVGTGKFYKAHTNERNGRNPKTGEAIKIPAIDRLAFKSSVKF